MTHFWIKNLDKVEKRQGSLGHAFTQSVIMLKIELKLIFDFAPPPLTKSVSASKPSQPLNPSVPIKLSKVFLN